MALVAAAQNNTVVPWISLCISSSVVLGVFFVFFFVFLQGALSQSSVLW